MSSTSTDEQSGPLAGVRVVELVGQGPGPYGAMILADLGADVVAVDRPEVAARANRERPATNPMMRGKRGVALDLKSADDIERLLAMIDRADVFVDPFRPGVCERLGLGPDVLCARNTRLIYGRMTGWGQDGPLAHAAGHDINYIALSGALHTIGYEGQPPTMPINLLGDFAGGGLVLAFGVAAALVERQRSGRGQVIDTAMVDGAAMILGPFFSAVANGFWGPRGTNHLDGGAHFYNVYGTADGKWVSVGAIEPQFYAEFVQRLGVADEELFAPERQMDRSIWAEAKERVATVFASRSRDEWCAIFEGGDACFAPVLAPDEVPTHPHMSARGSTTTINGVLQAQPAPRFSRSSATAGEPCHPGSHDVDDVVASWS
ncbi:MAG: CaiB/BaiF CoA transferase family protein [Ilumatobacteraceae bacterium]|jgi:alpha-methylacyl-CoA racemase